MTASLVRLAFIYLDGMDKDDDGDGKTERGISFSFSKKKTGSRTADEDENKHQNEGEEKKKAIMGRVGAYFKGSRTAGSRPPDIEKQKKPPT